MSTIHEEAPPTVLTDRQRRDAELHAIAYGLQCHCGREATSEQIERWIAELSRDPEPQPFSCEDDVHLCETCKGTGAPKGAGPGAVCWECHGDGEVREVAA